MYLSRIASSFSIANDSAHNIVANNPARGSSPNPFNASSKIEVNVPGWYSITASLELQGDIPASRVQLIGPDNAPFAESLRTYNELDNTTVLCVTGDIYMDLGGTVLIQAYQNSGAAVDTYSNGRANFVAVRGPL